MSFEQKATILLAEDDLQLAFIIKDNLEEEGFRVINCPDGEDAWQQFQKKQPGICLLDVNMPCRDGFSLAKKIRQKSDVVPIIFITAKYMTEDKLKGFETGADDYITKPFYMKELISRINVFLRRSRMLFPKSQSEYIIGGTKFIPQQQQLVRDKEEMLLTQKESRLLEFFCMHPNTVLYRKDILTYVWGKNDYFIGRSMDVFIARLRKILRPENSVFIETVPQTGYRFNMDH